jgi:hypothetical protein
MRTPRVRKLRSKVGKASREEKLQSGIGLRGNETNVDSKGIRLVITPEPHPAECVTGYLHTLCAANGYPRPSFLLIGLLKHSYKNGYRQVTADLLRAMTGISRSAATRICLVPTKRGSRSTVRLLGQEVHTSELRMDVFRICPLCVAERGRHEAAWHLKMVNWCARHRIGLLEACTSCGQVLEWNRPRVGECCCGADLTTQRVDAPKCSDSLARLTEVLGAALYRQPDDHPVPVQMSHLQHLSLYALSRLIFVLIEQLPPTGTPLGQGRTKDRIVTVDQLETVARILDDWPYAFQRHLTERYAAEVQSDLFGDGFRKAFYWALQTLDNATKTTATSEYAFIREQVYQFGSKYLPRERLVRGRRVQSPISCAWGTLLEAAAEIGMDPRTLAKRVKSGDIPAIEADYQRRNRNLLIDMQWLRRWKISRYAPVHVRDAAETIGISVSLLQAARKAGIYESRYHARRTTSFSEEDVELFSNALSRLADRYSVDGTPGGITNGKVSLRTTKSIELRIDLLRKLKGMHPEFWQLEEDVAAEDGGQVEVEVSGHRPVIVGLYTESSDGSGLPEFSLVPRSADTPRACSAREMVDVLVEHGLKEKDILLAKAGDGAMSEEVRREFLSHWEGEWERLRKVESELQDLLPEWILESNMGRYLKIFQEMDARKLEQAKELLGVWLPVWGVRIYPTFQFDGISVRSELRELLRLLPDDPRGWGQARWLGMPNQHLGERRPLEVAQEDLCAVVQAAQRAKRI